MLTVQKIEKIKERNTNRISKNITSHLIS